MDDVSKALKDAVESFDNDSEEIAPEKPVTEVVMERDAKSGKFLKAKHVARPHKSTEAAPTTEQLANEYEFDEDPAADVPPSEDQPAEKPVEAAAKPKHLPRFVAMAKELNFADDEIESLEPAQLITAVQLAREDVRRDARAGFRNDAQPTPETTEARTVEPAIDKIDDLSDVNADDYDPVTGKVIKTIQQIIKRLDRIPELEKLAGSLAQREQAREQETQYQQVERGFSEVGAPELFGEGPLSELTDKVKAHRRVMVWESLKQSPGTGPLAAQVKARAKLLFGIQDAPPKKQDPKITNRIAETNGHAKELAALTAREDEWKAGRMAKPTQRTAEERKGYDKYKRTVEQKLREEREQAEVEGEADEDAFD